MNFHFRGRVLVRAVVFLGIDQGERYLRHAGGLAIARPGENDVLHSRAAQGLGRLLAQHP